MNVVTVIGEVRPLDTVCELFACFRSQRERLAQLVELPVLQALEVDPENRRAAEALDIGWPVIDFLGVVALEEKRRLHPSRLPANPQRETRSPFCESD